jgi:hypothetical protein
MEVVQQMCHFFSVGEDFTGYQATLVCLATRPLMQPFCSPSSRGFVVVERRMDSYSGQHIENGQTIRAGLAVLLHPHQEGGSRGRTQGLGSDTLVLHTDVCCAESRPLHMLAAGYLLLFCTY